MCVNRFLDVTDVTIFGKNFDHDISILCEGEYCYSKQAPWFTFSLLRQQFKASK